MARNLLILGRFPPPIDGQAMATARLASLLDETHTVRRFNLSTPDLEHVRSEVRFRPRRLMHYLGLRSAIREACLQSAESTVLWTSVSPAPLGHLRDMLTVYPAFGSGQRVFGVVHRGDFAELFRRKWQNVSARRLIGRLDGIVFLNSALADACAREIPDSKRIVIPNTIDAAALCAKSEVERKRIAYSEKRPRRLLFLSNMIASKGYRDLLDAVLLLRDREFSFRVDFAGHWESDTDAVEFDHFVERTGLADVVTHHGGISDRARIKSMLLTADVFLLPSYYPTEAQPLSIIEAMSAGTPVITTTHGTLPELVTDGAEGRLVPPRDPQALADAISSVLGPGSWQHHSAAAYDRFRRDFSPEVVREKWNELIRSGSRSDS